MLLSYNALSFASSSSALLSPASFLVLSSSSLFVQQVSFPVQPLFIFS
jgi:hypothetical protein